MKPKENKGYNVGTYDECQTPPYALEPLIPYIPLNWAIWECAAGGMVLSKALIEHGYQVVSTDIAYDDGVNFLDAYKIADIIVTNPPYSIKYDWLEHCYEMKNPFALLMPIEMLGSAKGRRLFGKPGHGIEMIFMTPRVDFYMPNMGYKGGGAQFPTAWFTWKLNLPQQLNFTALNKPGHRDLPGYWEKYL